MAKAILGHVGLAPDIRLITELRRLQLRVKELEAELAQVRAVDVNPDLLTLSEPEPAFASH